MLKRKMKEWNRKEKMTSSDFENIITSTELLCMRLIMIFMGLAILILLVRCLWNLSNSKDEEDNEECEDLNDENNQYYYK